MKNTVTKRNTFKEWGVDRDGKLIDMSKESLNSFHKEQLKQVQFKNESLRTFEDILEEGKRNFERNLDRIDLLRDMELSRLERKNRKQSRTAFCIAMVLILTLLMIELWKVHQ